MPLNPLGGEKTHTVGPHSWSFFNSRAGSGPKICISSKFPSDIMAGVSITHFHDDHSRELNVKIPISSKINPRLIVSPP